MFVILLRFSSNKSRAGEFMQGHNTWIKRGFDEGVFLLAGTIEPKSGGAIVAHGTTLTALRVRVQQDPFVAEDIVSAEILEITPARVEPRLDFLIGPG